MPNLERLPLGDDAPDVVNAVIEVPFGSRGKYEYDEELGALVRDRVLPGAVRYPMDYGFVPSTLAPDGDALDVMVAAYDPAHPGTIVEVIPIGVLDLVDVSGEESNLLAVPKDDPRFDGMRSIDDVPRPNLLEIEQFFEVHKRLEGDPDVEIRGWRGAEVARELVLACRITSG